MNARQTLGRLAEQAAADHLSRQGWRLLGRNVRVGRGELDLIARRGRVLVFVEVKARCTATCGSPEDAVERAQAPSGGPPGGVVAGEPSLGRRDVDDVRFDIIAVDAGRPDWSCVTCRRVHPGRIGDASAEPEGRECSRTSPARPSMVCRATRVQVEADVVAAAPAFNIVGLPDAAVQESRERVRAAIVNSSTSSPRGASPSTWRRPTCARKAPRSTCRSPSPSCLPPARRGRQRRSRPLAAVGELGLDGSAATRDRRPGAGGGSARAAACAGLLLPAANAAEAALVRGSRGRIRSTRSPRPCGNSVQAAAAARAAGRRSPRCSGARLPATPTSPTSSGRSTSSALSRWRSPGPTTCS